MERVYAAPLGKVKESARKALRVHNFEVKDEKETTIRAVLPRRIGLVAGSGGEKVELTFTMQGESATKVAVKTQKTFVGRASQKTWDQPILDSIQELLVKP
jgi:hypothetical protein